MNAVSSFIRMFAIKKIFMLIQCTLCLGSNTDAQANVEKARAMLTTLLPGICWKKARWTEPVDFPTPSLFLNQLGIFSTTMPCDEVRHCFKEIERLCGRLPEDKAKGIVRMDIDLLTYGNEKLKESVI